MAAAGNEWLSSDLRRFALRESETVPIALSFIMSGQSDGGDAKRLLYTFDERLHSATVTLRGTAIGLLPAKASSSAGGPLPVRGFNFVSPQILVGVLKTYTECL